MLLINPEKIASVMALKTVPHSFAELDDMVVKGLPKGALKASIDHLFTRGDERQQFLYQIIPEATYKRRKTTLSASESERVERLARIIATASYVWNSDEEARLFLTSPHTLLEDRTPLDVSLTELGARRVEELLWQIFYGIPA
jgi:putative toxin-antitoxin system antitoxin component (TIGR02293 family)